MERKLESTESYFNGMIKRQLKFLRHALRKGVTDFDTDNTYQSKNLEESGHFSDAFVVTDGGTKGETLVKVANLIKGYKQ